MAQPSGDYGSYIPNGQGNGQQSQAPRNNTIVTVLPDYVDPMFQTPQYQQWRTTVGAGYPPDQEQIAQQAYELQMALQKTRPATTQPATRPAPASRPATQPTADAGAMPSPGNDLAQQLYAAMMQNRG
jgi:hypothetical protein